MEAEFCGGKRRNVWLEKLSSGAAPAETQVDILVSEWRQTGAVGGSTQEGLHIRDRRGVLGVRIGKNIYAN